MISKIKDSTTQLIQQYQKNDAVKKETETQSMSSTMSTTMTERVDLSSKAKEIQQIKQIIAETPEVRMDKVQELKQQIDAGKYQIDAQKVADKLAAESLIDFIV